MIYRCFLQRATDHSKKHGQLATAVGVCKGARRGLEAGTSGLVGAEESED
jgi:hypothetical protein